MLHRIVMVGLVVVGLVVAGLGVASATVWRPSDTAVMTTGSQTGATLLTTAPGVLSLVDQEVTVTASSSDDAKVVLALGSQVDVEGWVGDDPSLRVTGASDWETLTVETLPGAADEATDPATEGATDPAADPSADPATDPTEAAADAAAPVAPGPDPEGSDMWVESTSGTGSVTLAWDATSTDQVLLVAAVGEDAAAPQLTLSWPREVTTPLLWPGVALGALLVLLGLVYGFVTRGRGRKKTVPSVDRTAPASAPTGTPATGTLTRRQLRELAEQEQQAAAEAEKAPRPKRQWPWTGAIPVVEPAKSTPDVESEAAPEPHRPAWLPEGTGSTSGSSWRAAWGVSTPAPDATTSAPSATTPAAGATTPAPSVAPGSPAAPPRAQGASATGSGLPQRPAPVTSGERPSGQRPQEAQRAQETQRAQEAQRPQVTQPQRPAPTSTARPAAAPTASAPVAKPAAVPPARPVDQSSPFQRITLRSSDESAPARRLRREQQTPSAWSASRSPWAQEARPATGATPQTPDRAPDQGPGPGPATTDDTTKEND